MRFESLNPFRAEQENKEQRKAEFAEFIKAFDFDKLKELIRGQVRPDHGDEISICPAEKIVPDFSGSSGEYKPETKIIKFNPDRIRDRADMIGVNPDIMFNHVLIHEELHAASDTPCDDNSVMVREFNVGFSRVTRIKKSPITITGIYKAWNEGVTESMAREVTHDYVTGTGLFSEENFDQYKKTLEEPSGNPEIPYAPEVELVDALIDRLADASDKDRREIWQMVKDAFISGEGFNSQDLNQLTREVLPDGFLADLAGASAKLTVRRLTAELKSNNKLGLLSSPVIRHIKRMVEGYLESMGKLG
ncbi:MAG: hypothetical protein JW816_01565 [Candidatus Buchananbacteria bacterium]|nr:hypothetical protein [Candidatus Buchananbacteria bacterium]